MLLNQEGSPSYYLIRTKLFTKYLDSLQVFYSKVWHWSSYYKWGSNASSQERKFTAENNYL